VGWWGEQRRDRRDWSAGLGCVVELWDFRLGTMRVLWLRRCARWVVCMAGWMELCYDLDCLRGRFEAMRSRDWESFPG